MQIPGHIAVALAQHQLLTQTRFLRDQKRETLLPLLLASLFPDMVDKSIGYLLHLMPNGRHYAHNLFALILSTLAVTLIWGRMVGLAWFVGYLGHLVIDDEGPKNKIPWFFPLKEYHFHRGKGLKFRLPRLLREMAFLLLTLLVRRISR